MTMGGNAGASPYAAHIRLGEKERDIPWWRGAVVYQVYLRDSSVDRGRGINSQNFEKDFDAYDAGGGFDAGCTEWTVETNCIVGGQGGHIFRL